MEFELRYGADGERYHIAKPADEMQAYRMYDKVKKFAENHGITLTIALWDRGWLLKSETINPTAIIS